MNPLNSRAVYVHSVDSLIKVLTYNVKHANAVTNYLQRFAPELDSGVGKIDSEHEIYRIFHEIVLVKVGQTYCRAVVLSAQYESEFSLFLIDRGGQVTVSLADIRLINIPNEQESVLHSVRTTDKWTPEKQLQVNNIVFKNMLHVSVISEIAGVPLVKVTINGKDDLSNMFVRENIASPVDVEYQKSFLQSSTVGKTSDPSLSLPATKPVQPTNQPLNQSVQPNNFTMNQSAQSTNYTVNQPAPAAQATNLTMNQPIQPTNYALNQSVQTANYAMSQPIQNTNYPLNQFVQNSNYPVNQLVQNTSYPVNSLIQHANYSLNQPNQPSTYPVSQSSMIYAPPRFDVNNAYVPSVPVNTPIYPKVYNAEPDQPLQFVPKELDSGQKLEVYVTHIANGPESFYVMLKNDYDIECPMLMRKIIALSKKNIFGLIMPGKTCLAYDSNNVLNRAVVMLTENNDADVYFVDLGYTQRVSLQSLYEIPRELIVPKTMAIKVKLAKLSEKLLTEDAKNKFNQLLDDNGAHPITIQIVEQEEQTKLAVEVFIKQRGTLRNIKELLLLPTYERINLCSGDRYEVIVSHFDTLNCVNVQLATPGHISSLEKLMTKLQIDCESNDFSALTLDDLYPSMPVCALYNDNKWYRAMILDETTDSQAIPILFVDYGNEDTVCLEALQKISAELIKLRAQAIECIVLGDVEDLEEESTVLDTYSDLVVDQKFFLEVTEMSPDGIPIVQLMDENGTSVIDLLRETLQTLDSSQDMALMNAKYSVSNVVTESNSKTWESSVAKRFPAANEQIVEKKPEMNFTHNERRVGGGSDKWKKVETSPNEKQFDEYQADDASRRKKPTLKDSDEKWSNKFQRSESSREKKGSSINDRNDKWSDKYQQREEPSWEKKSNLNDRIDKRFDRYQKDEPSWEKKSSINDRNDRRSERYHQRDESSWSDAKPRAADADEWGEPSTVATAATVPSSDDNAFATSSPDNRWNKQQRENRSWKNKSSEKENWSGSEKSDGKAGARFNSPSRRNFGKKTDDNFSRNKRDYESAGDGSGRSGGWRQQREPFNKEYRKKDFSSSRNYKNDYNQENSWFSNKQQNKLPGFPLGAKIAEFSPTKDSSHSVFISWFGDPCSFFAHVINDELTNLMTVIQEEYKKRQPLNENEINVNDYVMAKFDDGLIYRARISRVAYSDITVNFVDFGNEYSCKSKEIWAISSEHCSIPVRAIYCKLKNLLPPVGDTWTEENVNNVASNYFGDNKYTLKITDQYTDTLGTVNEVELFDTEGRNVAERLINDSFARPAEALADLDQPVDLNTLIGQHISIHLPWYESSNKFTVHLEPETAGIIEDKLSEIAADTSKLIQLVKEDVMEQKFCLVEKEGLYRGLILSAAVDSAEKIKIRYIDFGDEDEVSLEKLFVLPPSLTNYHGQAFQCGLYGVKDDLTDEKETTLKETVEENDFIAYVNEVNSHRLLLTLYHTDGTPLSVTEDEDKEPIDPLIPLCVFRPRTVVTVSNVKIEEDGLVTAYVTQRSDQNTLQKLQETLQSFYEGGGSGEGGETALEIDDDEGVQPLPAEQCQIGSICAVKCSSQERWFRCRILSLNGSMADESADDKVTVKVLCVDCGTELDVNRASLFTLNKQFYYPNELSLKVSVGLKVKNNLDQVQQQSLLTAMSDKLTNTELEVEFSRYNARSDLIWTVQVIGNDSWPDVVYENCDDIAEEERVTSDDVENDIVQRWFSAGVVPLKMVYAESPISFWIQLADDVARIEQLSDSLKDVLQTILPSAKCKSEGSTDESSDDKSKKLFAVRDSDIWYRAIIDESNVARSVDFGYTYEKIDQLTVKMLPYSYQKTPYFAVRCTLDVENGPSSPDMPKEQFRQLTSSEHRLTGKIFILGNDRQTIRMFSDGKDIGQLFVDEGLVVAKRHNVFISEFISSERFFTVNEELVDAITRFSDQLNAAKNLHRTNLSSAEIGDIVLAKFPEEGEEEEWCRGVVLSANDDGSYLIDFIDIGKQLDCEEIKPLPRRLGRMPRFAMECSLESLTPVDNCDDIEQFIRSCIESSVSMEMTVGNWNEKDLLPVQLYVNSNNIVVDIFRTFDKVDIAENSVYPVYVSYVNSIADFYVQLENVDTFRMTESIQKTIEQCKILDQSSAVVGCIVAAQYPEDECWYRVKLLEVSDNVYRVHSIDFGNCFDASIVRLLPQNLIAPAPLTVHCALTLPEELAEWSESANVKFLELTSDETLYQMRVIKKANPNLVTLSENGIALTDELISLEVISSSVVKKQPATVCHIESLSEFWIQLDKARVEDMSEELTNAKDFDTIPIADTFPSDLVTVLAEDGLWYRALVLQVNDDNTCRARLIDYGEIIRVSELRQLPDDLKTLPDLAIKCSMKLPTELEDWPADVCELFKNYVESSPLYLSTDENIVNDRDKINTVSLTTADNIDLLSIILNGKTDDDIVNGSSETNELIRANVADSVDAADDGELLAQSVNEPLANDTNDVTTDSIVADDNPNEIAEELTGQVSNDSAAINDSVQIEVNDSIVKDEKHLNKSDEPLQRDSSITSIDGDLNEANEQFVTDNSISDVDGNFKKSDDDVADTDDCLNKSDDKQFHPHSSVTIVDDNLSKLDEQAQGDCSIANIIDDKLSKSDDKRSQASSSVANVDDLCKSGDQFRTDKLPSEATLTDSITGNHDLPTKTPQLAFPVDGPVNGEVVITNSTVSDNQNRAEANAKMLPDKSDQVPIVTGVVSIDDNTIKNKEAHEVVPVVTED